MLLIVLLLAVLTTQCAQAQLDNYKQSTGYVDVREGAHMFYWLFYTTAPVQNYTERPLIIRLEGGPGNSATSFGNFLSEEPFTENLEDRNKTWIKNFNVMFLDNPVGTGFSYVDDLKLLTKTNLEIATDFLMFIRKFYQSNPEFERVPLYIYGLSYGSKMAVEIAIQLNKAEKEGTIKSNLRGIFMANSWVSPLDHVHSWPRLIKMAALVDQDGYEKIVSGVKETETLYNTGHYFKSRLQRNVTISIMTNVTTAIDLDDIFNGILTTMPDTGSNAASPVNPITVRDDKYYAFMNSVIKKKFNIPEKVVWTYYSDAVYAAHIGDFMKPVVKGIEKLLNETDIVLTTLNGNYDVLFNTPGQVAWISKLKWHEAQKFKKARRQPLWVNDRLEGYYKKQGNFRFYEINGVGRNVPEYNPDAVNAIFRDVTTFG